MEKQEQIKKLKGIESKVRSVVINLSVLNNYAEWPAPMSIPIEGRMYTLYEFNNYPVN